MMTVVVLVEVGIVAVSLVRVATGFAGVVAALRVTGLRVVAVLITGAAAGVATGAGALAGAAGATAGAGLASSIGEGPAALALSPVVFSMAIVANPGCGAGHRGTVRKNAASGPGRLNAADRRRGAVQLNFVTPRLQANQKI